MGRDCFELVDFLGGDWELDMGGLRRDRLGWLEMFGRYGRWWGVCGDGGV